MDCAGKIFPRRHHNSAPAHLDARRDGVPESLRAQRRAIRDRTKVRHVEFRPWKLRRNDSAQYPGHRFPPLLLFLGKSAATSDQKKASQEIRTADSKGPQDRARK
jgi:hypothetical protein